MRRVAVFGLGVAGQATAKALSIRGFGVRVGDDHVTSELETFADEIDAPIYAGGDDANISRLLKNVDTLIPAPGVAPSHAVIRAAETAGIAIRTEIDVAYEWEQQRHGGPRPILGVTGTDGKTTTTMLTAALLRGAGLDVAEVGNTELPFIAAVDDDHDAFVVECSSFRLQYTTHFRCEASTWLNLAPDHLDWHPSAEHYAAAKGRLWRFARSSDVAVIPWNTSDASNITIDSFARSSVARIVTFASGGNSRIIASGAPDYDVRDGQMFSPHGTLTEVSSMWRSMPHDISNSLAACALVLETGLVPIGSIAASLTHFVPAHHRIEFIGSFDGSRWYDDSKATSPHASLTAIRAFEKLVLIAGGRNKGLNLLEMASEPQRMSAVVTIGDDASAIENAFDGICDVVRASSMTEAVALAAQHASPGVDVLLSPGCTSFDWYRNYSERGNDFQQRVRTYFGSPQREDSQTVDNQPEAQQ
jgi:UDP-N-acetylmuramoylalanine--D-glutamate ligase